MEQHPTPRLAHTDGVVDLAYDASGTRIITCGADKSIRIFKGFDDEDAVTIDQHSAAVTAIAVKGDRLISGSEDHHVCIFDLKRDNELEGYATRFESPVRAVAFNATGSLIAAAGDDFTIKVVTTLERTAKTLTGHDGVVRSIAFDPESDFLVSSSTDGTVRFWSLKDAACVKVLFVLPKINDFSTAPPHRVSWHPDGKYIAVPVGKAVTVYERDSWSSLFSFTSDGHNKDVAVCAWSPNGEYLASVSVDGEMMIWDMKERLSLERFRHPSGAAVSALAWHPKANELAWADTTGRFALWREPVPASAAFVAPAAGPGAAQQMRESATVELSAMFDDEEDIGPRRLKKAKARPADEENEPRIKSSVTAVRKADVDDAIEDAAEERVMEAPYSCQAAFQPSSTPLDSDRRYLLWNRIGIITSRVEAVNSVVDVEFHNAQAQRPLKIVDHYGYTMGALSEHSLALAAPAVSDAERRNPSVLFCRPYDAKTADEPWHVHFPENEDVEVLAVGATFVAVVTSKRYARIYSITGIAKFAFSIEGDVVSASAHDEHLIIVYAHARAPPEDQSLLYVLFDVSRSAVLSRGPVPLGPASELAWLGFTEVGMPATVDSSETVRLLSLAAGGVWVPAAELALPIEKDKPQVHHWVTAITETDVMCVPCKGELFPRVALPRPEVVLRPLAVPVVSNTDTAKYEQSHMLTKLIFNHLRGTDLLDAKTELQLQQNMDKSLLGCIGKLTQKQRPGRALDFTTMLSLPRSVDVAIKLAVHAKMGNLADSMQLVKQLLERQADESDDDAPPARSLATPRAQAPRRAVDSTPLPLDLSSPAPTPLRSQPSSLPRATPRAALPTRQAAEDSDEETPVKSSKQPSRPTPSATPSSLPRVPSPTPAAASSSPAVAAVANPFARKADAPVAIARSTSFVEAVAASPEKKRKPGMFLGQAPTGQAKKQKPEAKSAADGDKEKDKDKQKRGGSGYVLWLAAERKALKAAHPGLSVKDLQTKASELWRALSPEEKQTWNDKAKQASDAKTDSQPAAHEESAAPVATETSGDPEAHADGADQEQPATQTIPMATDHEAASASRFSKFAFAQ